MDVRNKVREFVVGLCPSRAAAALIEPIGELVWSEFVVGVAIAPAQLNVLRAEAVRFEIEVPQAWNGETDCWQNSLVV